MASSRAFFGRYKGPVIVLALAATLIIAVAIPREDARVERIQPVEFLSSWNGTLKRAEVEVGQIVKAGDVMVVLTDPQLEEQIAKLEGELKLAMLGTKEAVVQEPMMGMIGTLPRVVWETVTVPAKPGASASKEIVSKPKEAAQAPTKASVSDGQVEKAMESVFNLKVGLTTAETEVAEATTASTAAKTARSLAETTHEANGRQKERFEKLYEMGAIAKNKLDGGVAAFEESAQKLEVAQKGVIESESVLSAAQKNLAIAKDELSNAERGLETLRSRQLMQPSKPASIETKLTEAPKEGTKLTTKKVKRVVYGTSPEPVGTQPLVVDLVDSADATDAKRIEAIRNDLISLKKQRDALRLIATSPGRVIFVAAPGAKVGLNDKLVVIQPLASR